MKNIRHDDRPALLRAGLVWFAVLLLTACSAASHRPDPVPAAQPGPTTKVYVLRRGWHTDIAFPADGIPGPLVGIARDFPGARYLVFGFGDRRYQVAEHKAARPLAERRGPIRPLNVARLPVKHRFDLTDIKIGRAEIGEQKYHVPILNPGAPQKKAGTGPAL